MFSRSICWAPLLWATQVMGDNQFIPRASNGTATTPYCCYIQGLGVLEMIWYTSAVEVTVATVSTVVYKYDNTAITSFETVQVSSTPAFPSGTFTGASISGVPTNIVGTGDMGPYQASSTVVYGTEYTDAYGTVYTSPTPVWDFSAVSIAELEPTATGGGYGCPSPENGQQIGGDTGEPYPSGFYYAPDAGSYDFNSAGEILTNLPTQLRDWMASHVPPSTSSIWSSVEYCTLGSGDGIPVAHIPVTELTASALTTSTMQGNYGSVGTTTSDGPTTTTTSTSSSTSQYVPPTSTSTTSSTSTTASGGAAGGNPGGGNQGGSGTTSPGNSGGGNPGSSGTTSVGGSTGTTSASISAVGNPGSTGSSATGNPAGGSPTGPTTAASTASGSGNGNSAPVGSGNGATVVVPGNSPANSPTTAPAFTAGGSTYVANPASHFVIGSSTLTPGGTVVAAGPGGSTTYILPATGSSVIVNGATQAIASQIITPTTAVSGSSPAIVPTTAPAFTVGSSTYTANAASNFVIGSSTLTPGGTLTVTGSGGPTTFVLPTSGSSVIINGATQAIGSKTVSPAGIITAITMPTTTPFIVIGSSTFFENSASQFVIDGQTLKPGQVLTIGGDIISLAPGGNSVVIVEGTMTTTEGLGNIIATQGGFATAKPPQLTSNARSDFALDFRIMAVALGTGFITFCAL